MSQPPSFSHPHFPSHVCRLKKSIYGLWWSPCAWYSYLSYCLLVCFTISPVDPSLFTCIRPCNTILILVYVDDLLITGSSVPHNSTLINALQNDFPIIDLGHLNYFLGVEVTYSPMGMLLTQQKYILDLFTHTNMHLTKPVKTPMATTKKLTAFFEPLFDDPTLYYSIVGSLHYLSFTCPNLAFAIGKVCQYMYAPCISHW